MTDQPSPDDLAEAERALRNYGSNALFPEAPPLYHAQHVRTVLAMLDRVRVELRLTLRADSESREELRRLRLVEQAATALVESARPGPGDPFWGKTWSGYEPNLCSQKALDALAAAVHGEAP